MAKTLKQLLADEKRKKAKVKKLESELKSDKSVLAKIQKEIPVARKKEAAAAVKKKASRKKPAKKK